MDVGAGAGFPSTPIAIARSDLFVTQLDSSKKRVSFLQKVNSHFGLNSESDRQKAYKWITTAYFRKDKI